MRRIFLLFLVTVAVRAQELEQAMEAAREHVKRLESSAPNFVCKEEIISQLYMGDKKKRETRAQAVLTTTRRMRNGRGLFDASRTELRINGKATHKTDIGGPFVWQGGPAYDDLHILFNSDMGQLCVDHELVGKVKLNGKDALLIETHAPDKIANDQDCSAFRADSTDKIWLDAQTMNVMRVESHDPPANRIPGTDLTLTVDYAAVSFEGAEYWLPSHFISRLDFPGTPRHLQYEAFFSDYHKYTAESSFTVDPEH